MDSHILHLIDNIEVQAESCGDAERAAMVADLQAQLDRLEAQGAEVTADLRARIAALVEDTVEDGFDNMPV